MSKFVVTLALLVGACSDDAGAPPADPVDAGSDPYTEPDAGANGKYVNRDTACAQYVGAMQKKSDELGCTLDPPATCPATLERFENEKLTGGAACVWLYDSGVIDNCTRRIAGYKACEDFASKPCTLTVKPLVPACSDAGPADAADASDGAADASDGAAEASDSADASDG